MRSVVLFVVLYALWMVWSGMFDAFHLSLGAASSALVTFLTHDLVFRRKAYPNALRETARFLGYLPWLMCQIVSANFHVAYLVLSPKMPIDPQLVRFKSKLKDDRSRVVFGNSITLTPGTITADIVDDEYYVHALSKKTVDDLLSGSMERKVARIFLEE